MSAILGVSALAESVRFKRPREWFRKERSSPGIGEEWSMDRARSVTAASSPIPRIRKCDRVNAMVKKREAFRPFAPGSRNRGGPPMVRSSSL